MILGSLISGVADLGRSYLQGKVEEKKAIQAVKIKRIESDSTWENTMADATKSSWKDEYLVLVLTSPIIFIGYGVAMDNPEIINRVNLAFATLANLPEFYQILLYAAVLASFGLKVKDQFKK